MSFKSWIFVTKRRKKLEPDFILHSKINSKWANGLNIRSETVKILEEKGCYLYCIPAQASASTVHRDYLLTLYLGFRLPPYFPVLRWGLHSAAQDIPEHTR